MTGYSIGCDDADVSYFQRNINQVDKGPTFQTPEFIKGYNAGFSTCSPSSESASSVSSAPQSSSPQRAGDINWYKICINPIVDILITEPCHTLTTNGGYTLTPQGEKVLACLGGGAASLAFPEILALKSVSGCGSSSSSSSSNSFSNSFSNNQNEDL